MGLDIRYPIGSMFAILGLILIVFGFVSDKEIYAKSLGININLWWGFAMLAFGAAMLVMATRADRSS